MKGGNIIGCMARWRDEGRKERKGGGGRRQVVRYDRIKGSKRGVDRRDCGLGES